MGTDDDLLIEKYLVPLLDAEETKFFNEGKKRINVPALAICHTALDTAFKLRGSYAPPIERKQSSLESKVIVVDISRPKREAINVMPVKSNGTPPAHTNAHD